MMNRRHALATMGTFTLGMAASDLRAATGYEIQTLTRDPANPDRRMLFSPNILKVPAGSRITFTPTDPGHNVQTTPGMLPDGAAAWRFGFGKSGSVTLSRPGFYGYHCMPHRSMGMVGLIIVEGAGMKANLAAAKAVRQPGKAGAVWADLWAKAEALV